MYFEIITKNPSLNKRDGSCLLKTRSEILVSSYKGHINFLEYLVPYIILNKMNQLYSFSTQVLNPLNMFREICKRPLKVRSLPSYEPERLFFSITTHRTQYWELNNLELKKFNDTTCFKNS